MITRRALVLSATALPLAACGGSLATVVDKAPQLVADAALIAEKIAAVAPQVTAALGAGADAVNRVTDIVGRAQRAASDVAAAVRKGVSAAAAITALSSVVGAFEGMLPASGTVSRAIAVARAASALMPAVFAAVGIPLAGPVPEMTPEQARVVLRAT